MTLLQKRIGAAVLVVLLLPSAANWLLDWQWFGKFDALVNSILVLFVIVYVYIIPPSPDDLDKR